MSDEDKIIEALNKGNHQDMYVVSEEETVPERRSRKSINEYIKSVKNKIFNFFFEVIY